MKKLALVFAVLGVALTAVVAAAYDVKVAYVNTGTCLNLPTGVPLSVQCPQDSIVMAANADAGIAAFDADAGVYLSAHSLYDLGVLDKDNCGVCAFKVSTATSCTVYRYVGGTSLR